MTFFLRRMHRTRLRAGGTMSRLLTLAFGLVLAPTAFGQYQAIPRPVLTQPQPTQPVVSNEPVLPPPLMAPAQPAPPPKFDGVSAVYHFKKPAGPVLSIDNAVQQVQAGGDQSAGDLGEYQISLDPPGIERLFRLDTEPELERRIQQEAKQRTVPERVAFPEKPVLSRVAFAGRNFQPNYIMPEPHYVCYQRLYNEQLNFERYGWSLGAATPFVSAAAFFKDVAFLPMHLFTQPCFRPECDAGLGLPGDPVPLLLYPPRGFDVAGITGETIVWLTLALALP